MEHGAACWVDGKLSVEEWDRDAEEERVRERRETRENRKTESETKAKENEPFEKIIDVPFDTSAPTTSSSSNSKLPALPPPPKHPSHLRPKPTKKPKQKPKPPILLPLKTPNNAQLTVPPAATYEETVLSAGGKAKREKERDRAAAREGGNVIQVCAVAGLEESLMGGSLQFE